MTLLDATREYVANKQALGMVFETEARILKAFVKFLGGRTGVGRVQADTVREYLNGNGKITRFWHRKHDALTGFWRYAIQRGYTDQCPLPPRRPKLPNRFTPYIYTRAEVRRLLDGTKTYQTNYSKLDPGSFRAILLLLYGAGLRISEAIGLSCADVDLRDAMLTIRCTKFYKTRRIAISPQLCQALKTYDFERQQAGHSRDKVAPFFTYKKGGAITRCTLEDAFMRLRQHVGVSRVNARYQPRIHDLRHTFAVHRLIAWYQSGADVQRLLPGLSIHLGHVEIKCTQVYLTMTPDLLAEASLRFEKYAGGMLYGTL